MSPISNSVKGTHAIRITGTILGSQTGRTYTSSSTWGLTILPENTSPPLMASPVNQDMTAGTSVKYTMPSAIDVDGDGIKTTVDLGSASGFIKYSSGTFTMSPKAANVGTYTITVKLEDDSPTNKLSISYTFTVTVNAGATTVTNSTNTTNSTLTNSTSNSTS